MGTFCLNTRGNYQCLCDNHKDCKAGPWILVLNSNATVQYAVTNTKRTTHARARTHAHTHTRTHTHARTNTNPRDSCLSVPDLISKQKQKPVCDHAAPMTVFLLHCSVHVSWSDAPERNAVDTGRRLLHRVRVPGQLSPASVAFCLMSLGGSSNCKEGPLRTGDGHKSHNRVQDVPSGQSTQRCAEQFCWCTCQLHEENPHHIYPPPLRGRIDIWAGAMPHHYPTTPQGKN